MGKLLSIEYNVSWEILIAALFRDAGGVSRTTNNACDKIHFVSRRTASTVADSQSQKDLIAPPVLGPRVGGGRSKRGSESPLLSRKEGAEYRVLVFPVANTRSEDRSYGSGVL